MKTQLHPAVVVVVLAVVVIVAGYFVYRGLVGNRVDTSASMSPELRAKIIQSYGGGARRTSAPPRR